MRAFFLVGLLGLAAAQDSSSLAISNSTSVASSSISSTTSPSVATSATLTASSTSTSVGSSTSSAAKSVITVAQDGSGQFTAINAAISYAQNSGYPTVSVLPGTYTEAVTVPATATVTVIGQSTATSDYRQNQVVVQNALVPLTIGSNSIKAASFYNINFITTATAGTASAVSLRGSNIAFIGCQIISPGQGAITSSYGITLIANSYVEGTDKLFYNFPTAYVFNSTISATTSSTNIVYNKGQTVNGAFYNSTVVFDSCSIAPKTGSSATGVFLAAPNANGAQAVYRNSSIASYISSAGVHPLASSYVDFYGEYLTTGAGAYSSNAAARSTYDHLLTAAQVSAFTIDQVFGLSFPPYASYSTSWVDQTVYNRIQANYAAQASAASSSSTTSSAASTSSTTSSVSSTVLSQVSTSSASANGTVSGSTSASVITSASASANTTTSATATSTSTASSCSAAAASGTYTVSQNPGPCDYSNITAAISALPNDSKAKTIMIAAGTYTEQLSITRNGKVTLIGATNFTNDYTGNKVIVQISNGQLTSAGKDESTPVINAKKTNDNSGLAVYNINFVNTYPQTANTAALAGDFYGANIAAYGCSFVGFQDTLLANKGTQVFSNSYIEGSIDFIWGFSTAYFHRCVIAHNTPGGCISAMSRATNTTAGGYVFDECRVTYTSTYGNTFGTSFLGRPYSQYSIAVFMNSFIDKHISSAGWSVWQTSNPQTSGVLFGEYNNTGPSSWQAGTARASFATNLTDAQASAYSLSSWIGDTSWLDMTAYNYMPSYNWTAAATATSTTSASSTTTGSSVTSTASINAHPDSGSVPPAQAVLVSPNGAVNGSFSNITAALASLPSDNTNQTIFIYSGSYVEQIPSINRPGAVRIIGQISGNPGQSYKDNQVNVNFARGLSVSPLPTGHSDAETAVVSTASNRISFYNINIVNTDNLDGSEASYVTLAASIYGNDIGFYACSFNGWQDTLLNGATTGYQYYESCYIGGAIDFIWGYSKAYFKGCTIGAKRASSAMTAQSRASSSAIGGYIFDNCLFTKAPDATVDLTNKVYLGRPYSQYALVVVKNSYIDSVINPSGWKIWSATDPRTAYITFAEYNNSGPSNWENNVAARQAFGNATLLTSDTYPLDSVMDSTSWIDMTYWNSISTPLPAVINTTTTANNITAAGNSTYDGTTPPAGALIVSKTPIAGQTVYGTIQAALNAAPTSSKTNATIFIYPGTYNEQLIVNKSGTTIFMGYSNSTDDYLQNQVSISFNHGVSTQSTTGSDSDSATVYATGNYFYAYNINFLNTYGTTQDIASLGFAVKSSKYAALYSCLIYGNQDTLEVSGNLFMFKGYVEGNVDFIFGAGSAYFLNTTIAANEDDINVTADKRATNTTQAGFVFDQCSIVPANGQTGFTNVGLGRPWNNLARVAYVNCYLDSMIEAAGWNVWSKSSPQTDQVTFGEYHNYGPGSSVCGRANFSQQLTDSSVVQFQLANLFLTTSWIDFTKVDVSPFVPGIGSAPAACATTSSVLSVSVTRTSSTVSSTLASSTVSTVSTSTASTTTSSVPVVTVYTTKLITDKETLTTSITNAGTTVVSTVVVTEDDGLTVTPSPVYKTATAKATSVVTTTATVSGKDATVKSTSTVSSTVTAAQKTSTVQSTTTVYSTETVTGKVSTISEVSTVFATSTVNPKATTTTENDGTVVTTTLFSTPKGTTVTSSTTITASAGATKTSSLRASTVTVLSTSTKTTTKKTTVVETCVPSSGVKLFRRGLVGRAAGTTTVVASSTVVSYVKTVTVAQAGNTAYATVTSTSTIGKTTTLKAATSTVTVTNAAVSTSTVTVSQAGSTVTAISTVTQVYTSSAAVQTVTALTTKTSVTTESVAGSPVTAYKTTTKATTITAPQSTVTVTKNDVSTSTIRSTLDATTATVYKTATVSEAAVTVTVTPAASTKTSTVKSTMTVFNTATSTKKNAPVCTA